MKVNRWSEVGQIKVLFVSYYVSSTSVLLLVGLIFHGRRISPSLGSMDLGVDL